MRLCRPKDQSRCGEVRNISPYHEQMLNSSLSSLQPCEQLVGNLNYNVQDSSFTSFTAGTFCVQFDVCLIYVTRFLHVLISCGLLYLFLASQGQTEEILGGKDED
jgi:hypothetical protein